MSEKPSDGDGSLISETDRHRLERCEAKSDEQFCRRITDKESGTQVEVRGKRCRKPNRAVAVSEWPDQRDAALDAGCGTEGAANHLDRLIGEQSDYGCKVEVKLISTDPDACKERQKRQAAEHLDWGPWKVRPVK